MPTVCGQIARSFVFDCNNPLQGGTRDRVAIINQADWDAATIAYSVTNPMVVTSITLPVGKNAYYVDGKNNSNAPSYALIKQAFADVYDHLFGFKIFDLSNAAKAEIQAMVGGKYVVIWENNFRGSTGESAYEILGAGVGMEFKTNTRDPLSADTQGAYDLSMGSPEASKEGKMPLAFFDTDYATTKTAFEALFA